MPSITTYKRFCSEGNTGDRFGSVDFRTTTHGNQKTVEILMSDYHSPEDIKAAKDFLLMSFEADHVIELYASSEEEAFSNSSDEKPPKPKTLYQALKDGTLDEFDDDLNDSCRYY